MTGKENRLIGLTRSRSNAGTTGIPAPGNPSNRNSLRRSIQYPPSQPTANAYSRPKSNAFHRPISNVNSRPVGAMNIGE